MVSVKVDFETSEVASAAIQATREEDETPSEVSVSIESETDEPDEVWNRVQRFVDAAAPSSSLASGLLRRRNGRSPSPTTQPTRTATTTRR